jgi:nucleoid-associated protein YgaU
MPNDAKLGLVIGVGLVIAVAVIFFRKELVTAIPADGKAPVNVGSAPPPGSPRPTRVRAGLARPVSRTRVAAAESRRHTVVEGETLYTIAEQYYGDGERFFDLYQHNRDVVKRPDRLEPGTVLEVPDLAQE